MKTIAIGILVLVAGCGPSKADRIAAKQAEITQAMQQVEFDQAHLKKLMVIDDRDWELLPQQQKTNALQKRRDAVATLIADRKIDVAERSRVAEVWDEVLEAERNASTFGKSVLESRSRVKSSEQRLATLRKDLTELESR